MMMNSGGGDDDCDNENCENWFNTFTFSRNLKELPVVDDRSVLIIHWLFH